MLRVYKVRCAARGIRWYVKHTRLSLLKLTHNLVWKYTNSRRKRHQRSSSLISNIYFKLHKFCSAILLIVYTYMNITTCTQITRLYLLDGFFPCLGVIWIERPFRWPPISLWRKYDDNLIKGFSTVFLQFFLVDLNDVPHVGFLWVSIMFHCHNFTICTFSQMFSLHCISFPHFTMYHRNLLQLYIYKVMNNNIMT